MIEMFTKIPPMPGFEWIQVSEGKFQHYVDDNFLVAQTNGKIRKYYDCELDAITAIKEMHNFDFTSDYLYYIQQEKKK